MIKIIEYVTPRDRHHNRLQYLNTYNMKKDLKLILFDPRRNVQKSQEDKHLLHIENNPEF